MESNEAKKAVFSRVQSIDPENAYKIMCYILLHHGEKDMIRFAYGPETLIISIVNRAKTDFGLSSNTLCASSVVNPNSNSIASSRPPNPLSVPSPRFLNNGGFNPSSSSPSSPSVWGSLSPNSSHSLSYAAVVNGSCNTTNGSFSSSSIGSPRMENFMDEYSNPLVLPSKNGDFFDQSMDLALSPGCRSDSVMYPHWENSINAEKNAHFHRRSSSFNDMYFGTDDSTSGFGFKPCLYFARGFCKNGSTCNFVHGGEFSDNSPCKYDAFEQCQEEILRSNFFRQQRLAAQLMAGVNLPSNKLNFIQNEAQRSALMMGEEFHKLNRVKMSRNEFSGMGMVGESNHSSRQIYLTFPADSTFKEEDVSNYFSIYGPVQDVRIPYQQKRMFGFVTFVYPETVRLILAKGNPHFVCDSRVLVKPYKEKGKIPDKKQQLERGEFSSCSSPSRHEYREPYDFQLGGRMFYNTQEMLLRKKFEEQALELQGRRLMNLQLLDLKNHQHHSSNLPLGSPIVATNRNSPPPFNEMSQNASEENNPSLTGASNQQLAEGVNVDSNDNVKNQEDNHNNEECELHESLLEHILPDNLFASPTKSASEHRSSVFSPTLAELNDGDPIPGSSPITNTDSLMPTTAPLNMAHKSCFFEMPRVPPGHEALGM